MINIILIYNHRRKITLTPRTRQTVTVCFEHISLCHIIQNGYKQVLTIRFRRWRLVHARQFYIVQI